MLMGPRSYNMARKAINANEVNVFLKTHLTRAGLAPVWLSAPLPPPPHIYLEPQNVAHFTTWIPRNPGKKPGTSRLTSNPSGCQNGGEAIQEQDGTPASQPASQYQRVPGTQWQL